MTRREHEINERSEAIRKALEAAEKAGDEKAARYYLNMLAWMPVLATTR